MDGLVVFEKIEEAGSNLSDRDQNFLHGGFS